MMKSRQSPQSKQHHQATTTPLLSPSCMIQSSYAILCIGASTNNNFYIRKLYNFRREINKQTVNYMIHIIRQKLIFYLEPCKPFQQLRVLMEVLQKGKYLIRPLRTYQGKTLLTRKWLQYEEIVDKKSEATNQNSNKT